jgi:hypothetical protein
MTFFVSRPLLSVVVVEEYDARQRMFVEFASLELLKVLPFHHWSNILVLKLSGPNINLHFIADADTMTLVLIGSLSANGCFR